MNSTIEKFQLQKYLTDGGLETSLIFHQGIDLPAFAAFPLLETNEGQTLLEDYYESYIQIARKQSLGFVLESPTWRANKDWGEMLGYSESDLDQINQSAVKFLGDICRKHSDLEFLVSGCIGPRGDGYNPNKHMTANEAYIYHKAQIQSFQQAGAQMVTAMTMTYPQEAIGIVRAAKDLNMPVVISITPETDGRLISGYSLKEFIEMVDDKTEATALYYMVNCAHTSHFDSSITKGEGWVDRVQALRSNASCASHEELDESETLDDGDPQKFGEQHLDLSRKLTNLRVIGGCCGTDARHVEAASVCFRSC